MEGLQLGDHVCALVDGAADGFEVIAQAVAVGLAAGDRVMVFTESVPPAQVLARLETRGILPGREGRPGQLEVLSAREAYLPAGRFEPDRLMESLLGHVERATLDGFPGLRLVGDMAWALSDPAAVGQLAAYEAQVNHLYMDGQALGVCVYDRHAFDGALLQQVTCAHPATRATAAAPGWAPLLRIRRTSDPYGLRLTGEADYSSGQAVAATVEALVDQHPDPATPIHVDLAGLRFADATTAALLTRLALRAPSGVRLIGYHGPVARVLACLGITELPAVHLSRATGTELEA
ncbi:MEDS domain-containing protein [Micromonospora sp. ATCC 39149]|uniref:MEDS domain-containing protein n=1 Tax=Micromonospora carbonacea TaxID=47853 RepID=A0A7D5YAN5_9ACTN|nr:MEDS domain-containing protein [Micromonospora sp. ATCC 39149]QLK00540.1 MEDS domain-containing protein [Micromonospora carbonacea]